VNAVCCNLLRKGGSCGTEETRRVLKHSPCFDDVSGARAGRCDIVQDSLSEDRTMLAGGTDDREQDWICFDQASDADEAGEDGEDVKEDVKEDHVCGGETSRCSRLIEEMSSAMVSQDVSL
jgi:hypothetical protein